MLIKSIHKETFEAIKNSSYQNIESTITQYTLNFIKPANSLHNLEKNIKIDKNLMNILKKNNFPICFESLNFLFESLLDEQYKSENGIVFTPKYIADFICQNIFNKFDNLDSIKIIDPSCGCGIFLISAIEILRKKTKKSLKEIIQNQIFGIDISHANVKRVILLLKLFALIHNEVLQDNDINIKCIDSLKQNWDEIFLCEFDCIIGNPPYVNPHLLDKKQAEFLKQNFITTSKGVFNIFYAFIEQSIKNLKNNGFISFIVPNNFLTISAAKPLRDFLESYLVELIDFKDNMIFKPIRTYNAIITLNKQNSKTICYANIKKTQNISNTLENIHFQILNKKNIFYEKWRFIDSKTNKNIQKIESQFFSLSPFVNAGIATLKDEVYRVNFDGKDFFKIYKNQKYLIDKELIKPIYKIPELKYSMQSGHFIFPYTINNKITKIIDEQTMKTKFNNTYKYLKARKDDLDSRDKGRRNCVTWYAYGRTQGLNRYGKKLLFSTFALNPNFFLIENKESLFCNGYAVFENDIIEIEILQKILNSYVMKYYIENTSYQIEGGYFCYQKKYIEKFGIPFLDSKEKKFLLSSSDKEIDLFLIKKYDLEF